MVPKRAGAKARSEASGSASARTPTPPPSEAFSGSSGRGIVALAATGETKARQVTSQIDELLAAQKRAREEKKRLANEVRNAKRRKQRLTKRARLLTTEDLLTVVALREAERASRESASQNHDTSDELVASERSENEGEVADAATANGAAEPILEDAERAQNE